MATKSKKNPYYYPLNINDKNGSLLLSQVKTFDAKRLQERIERISEKQLVKIKRKIVDITLRFPSSS